MSSFTARIFGQQQLGYVPHTSTSGETWQLVQKCTATSNGAAGGTTVIDTNSDSSGTDAYNGRYWIEMTSGTQQGEWARIVDDDGAGTYTLENNGFDAQIDSGDEFSIWLSPEPVVVIDSSSGETNAVDAVRAEADDFWIDYYLVPITGTHRGKIAQITDSTSSSGTFVLAASFGSALAAGDVCLLRKFIEVEGVSFSGEEPYIARPQNRVNFSRGDGTRGAKGGTVSFNTHIYASGSLAASGSKANSSPLSGLFQAAGHTEIVDTSSTVGAGSTTTAIAINTASHENHTPGGAIIHNGNLRWITSTTDGGVGVDTVTVNPALPVAPASSDVLYAVRTYRKSLTGDELGVTIEWEVDGVRTTMTGCKGSVALSDGTPPTLAWSFSVDHFVQEIEAAPYDANAAYTTEAAILNKDRECWLGTTASPTKTNIGGLTASLNATVAAKPVQGSFGINGRAGYQFTDLSAAGGSFNELLDSSGTGLPQLLRWTARTSQDLRVAYGSHGSSFGLRVPVAMLMERPSHQDQDGLAGTTEVFEAQDAGTTTNGASAIVKVPDLAFYLS